MLDRKSMDRINELSKKSKNEGLTEEEKVEQQELRKRYLEAFRGNFDAHLHNIKVVDAKGKDVTPKKLKESKKNRNKYKN